MMRRSLVALICVASILLSSCSNFTQVGNKIYQNCVGNLTPCINDTFTLGNPTHYFSAAYIQHIYTANTTFGASNVTTSGGTAKSIPKFTSATNIENSLIVDNGTHAGVGQIGMDLPRMWTIHDGTGNPQSRLSYTAGTIYTDLWSTHAGYFAIMPSAGRVGINDDTPSQTLDVGGNAGIQGNLTMNANYINDLADPSAAQDAVTLAYYNAHLPSGGTGNVTASGMTAGNIPLAISTTGITNSIITANATTVGVAGNLVPTGNIVMSAGATVDGVDISSLSASGNVTYTQSTIDYLPKWNGVAGNLVNSTISSNATSVYISTGITVTGNITGANVPLTNNVVSLTYIIDGGGSAITTGIKGDLEIPFNCTIDRVTALADATGNVTVSIWKSSYASYPPIITGNITALAPVSIVSSNKSQDSTLSGWTKVISAGDILRYNVDLCAVITRITISLRAVKN